MNISLTHEEIYKIIEKLPNTDIAFKVKLQSFVNQTPEEKKYGQCYIKGYFQTHGREKGYHFTEADEIYIQKGEGRNIILWRNLTQCNAAKALARLTQWYGNLDVSLRDCNSTNLCIIIISPETNEPVTFTVSPDIRYDNKFLVFSNREAAQNFIDSHKTLLKEASYFL